MEDMEALLTGGQSAALHRSQKFEVYFHPEGTEMRKRQWLELIADYNVDL